MEKRTVLVTGIGGNVGQGILRNIASMNLPIRLIGTDIANFTAGNHLCDKTYQIPYAVDPSFIPTLQRIIENENVDLIIPSTDYEIYHLALNRQQINANLAASKAETTKAYLDKYESFLLLSENNIPFAKTWLASEYDGSESSIIAKPREGRGSRGIILNPDNPNSLPSEYIIQPLLTGVEITTAAYVTKTGKLHGIFTMERSLTNGTTTQSKVVFNYNSQVKHIAQKMIDLGGLAGSFNIQSIVNANEEIVPFEINCRISGTNSIRHNLGFKDVVYTIQEYLLDQIPEVPKPIPGVATRILMDVIYPMRSDFKNLDSRTSEHIIY